MAPLARKTDSDYTYDDYLKWPEDERWEIIEGVPYNMTPAPSTNHQRISHILNGIFYNFLQAKKCKAFAAPFDVRFHAMEKADREITTVVQPDISVVCDENKLDHKGCIGAPDLIVEILSDSTAYRDSTAKLKLYEKHGVREYWIVNPDAQYIMVYNHNGFSFEKPEYLKPPDILKSNVLKGLEIPLGIVFEK